MTTTLSTVVLLVGAMVMPAWAHQGIGVLTGGVMEVGDNFNGSCTRDNAPGVTGRGLGYPALVPKVADLDNVFRILVPTPGPGLVPSSLTWVYRDDDTGMPGVAAGTLALCGHITQVLGGGAVAGVGAGPWCGMHKGYNAKGKNRFVDQVTGKVFWQQFSDVGWKKTAGRKVVMLGKVRYQMTGPGGAKGTKLFRWAQYYATVDLGSDPGNSPPGQNCSNAATGATWFTLNGVMAITTAGGDSKADVVEWNDNSDDDADRNDSATFCKGSRDSDNNGVPDTDCPYAAKPERKPKDT